MNTPSSSHDDEISFSEIYSRLRIFSQVIWADKGMLFKMSALGALVGLFIALGSAEEYSAKVRLLPYRSGAVGAGNLSGLAGLAGIRLPAGGADQTITADLYPEVARSQDFRIAVAETPLFFSSLGRKATTVEYLRDLRESPIAEVISDYTIGLPGKLVSLVNVSEGAEPSLMAKSDSTLIASYDSEYLELIHALGSRLTVSVDKKTSIITITGEMPDPYAAADLVRVTSERLMERVIAYESQKAAEQFRFINSQYVGAKDRYERAQLGLASFSDRNRALMSATSQINRDQLQREYDLAFDVYQQFSREQEQARIKMNQDTPVFTILEKVTVPTTRARPRRARTLALWLATGALLGILRIGLQRARLPS